MSGTAKAAKRGANASACAPRRDARGSDGRTHSRRLASRARQAPLREGGGAKRRGESAVRRLSRAVRYTAISPSLALLGSPLPEGAGQNALRPGCGVPSPSGEAARGGEAPASGPTFAPFAFRSLTATPEPPTVP